MSLEIALDFVSRLKELENAYPFLLVLNDPASFDDDFEEIHEVTLELARLNTRRDVPRARYLAVSFDVPAVDVAEKLLVSLCHVMIRLLLDGFLLVQLLLDVGALSALCCPKHLKLLLHENAPVQLHPLKHL